MIKEVVKQQNIDCIGGFIAVYADAIMAHLNPSNLQKNDIVVIVKNDGTIWAKKTIQKDQNQNNSDWLEIPRENIKKKKSPILKKVCFFEIKKGDLFGTYVISDDLITNEHFSDEKSYLNNIAD